MHIYVDESGLFIPTSKVDAWCVVAAYMHPETETRKIKKILTQLKVASGRSYKEEIKLRDINEKDYFKFLCDLKDINGTLYCTASNMAETNNDELDFFKSQQANYITMFIDRLTNEEAIQHTLLVSKKILELPNQLYMQLVCQVNLFSDIMRRGILYHVQRHPKSLKQFRWRIDQKNSEKTKYEIAFETVLPNFLETISLQKLCIKLSDCDYSAMNDFIFKYDEMPTHLKEIYGIETNADGAFNLHKILTSNFAFSDSRSEGGIQIADLLASGIRKLLRNEFHDSYTASTLIGSIMVQNEQNDPPINIFSFSEKRIENSNTLTVIENFSKNCRPMMLRAAYEKDS